jgi:predicted transcriptional regulator
MSASVTAPDYIRLAAEIVSAYVSNNSITTQDMPLLIHAVHEALVRTAQDRIEEPEVGLSPAVSVKKSVTPDYIICLEDGKRFKSLKRHLRTSFSMTPEQYRVKWGLPRDYPMVAPNYAKRRSELARTLGLGQQRRKRTAAAGPAASAKPKHSTANANSLTGVAARGQERSREKRT